MGLASDLMRAISKLLRNNSLQQPMRPKMLDRWFFAIYYRIVASVQLLTGQIVSYWPGNWFG